MKKIYVKFTLALATCGLLFSCANPVNNGPVLPVAEKVSAKELVDYNNKLNTDAKKVYSEDVAGEVFSAVINEFNPINQQINKLLGEQVKKDPKNETEIKKMESFKKKYDKKLLENSNTKTNFSLSETINFKPGIYDLKNNSNTNIGTGKIITFSLNTTNSVKFENNISKETIDSNMTINSVTTIPDASKISLSDLSNKYIKAYKAANAMLIASDKINTGSQTYLDANYVIMFDNVPVSNSPDKYQGILLITMTTSASGSNPDKISASITFYDVNGNVTLPTITQKKE